MQLRFTVYAIPVGVYGAWGTVSGCYAAGGDHGSSWGLLVVGLSCRACSHTHHALPACALLTAIVGVVPSVPAFWPRRG